MSVKVCFSGDCIHDDFAGLTVRELLRICSQMLDIPSDVVSFVNQNQKNSDYVLREVDEVEFLKLYGRLF
jgi:hypothetical protein